MRAGKGFTLLEIIVVVVVIGILASLTIPQYMVAVERTKSSEGVTLLDAVRGAQLRYYQTWGDYTAIPALLDYHIESPKFFNDPIPGNHLGGYIVIITRNTVQSGFCGSYRLGIRPNGEIGCAGGDNDICNRMGYLPWPPS